MLRPNYDRALKALQEAHDACFKSNRDVLGMSHGPFSGVNEALGIVDTLERENTQLKTELNSMMMITVKYGEMKLKPLKWVVRRLPSGQGEIIGEYCTMSGEYSDLVQHVHILGGVVEFEDACQS